jgi:hypothetical protein
MRTTALVLKCALVFSLCVLALACNSRGALSPDKALVGHWVREGDSADRYFSTSKCVYVAQGAQNIFPYKVVSVSNSSVRLKETGPLIDWTANFEFTADRKEMTESRVRDDGTSIGHWKWRYADDKLQP